MFKLIEGTWADWIDGLRLCKSCMFFSRQYAAFGTRESGRAKKVEIYQHALHRCINE
jgi:hypothetical protein